MKKNHLIIGAVVILAVALILFTRTADEAKNTATTENNIKTADEAEEILVTRNEITSPRQSAGTMARVDKVLFEAPGYIVAHKVNDDGTTGTVIGNSDLISQRETTDITFELKEDITERQNIILMLHLDNGDKTYEFPGADAPVLDEDGVPVMVQVPVGPATTDGESDAVDDGANTDDADTAGTGEEQSEAVADEAVIQVVYTDEGFDPDTITVNSGETVRWINNSSRNMRVASAVHPTHTLYPAKSGDDCLGSSFDACVGVAQGGSWEFTFDEIGSWKYHDHLNASKTGTVEVN